MTTAAWIVAGVCLLVEALFSGSEVAVVAADRIKIRQNAEAGRSSAKVLLRLLGSPQRLLATTLMGTQLAIVTATITVTFAFTSRWGEGRAELYTLAALTPVLVILGEIVPKSIAQQNADVLAPRLCYLLWGAQRIFTPIVWLLTRFTGWIARLLGIEAGAKLVTREDLELIMKGKPGVPSEITDGERKMISRIFDFGDRTAYDVMVPLSSVAALDEAATIEDAVKEVEDKGYTRFPVFRERIDRVVGIVHSFEVLKAGRNDATVGAIMTAPSYVPENQPCIDVLVDLQRTRKGMAVVVDEYGGAVGLVTIEDILEEIVGEIEDEYDEGPVAIRKESEGAWRVRGRTAIAEVNRQLKLDLPEGADYETLAGLVLDHLKHIPRVGESVRIGQVLLKVTEASERAVEEVQLRLAKRR
jgi:CBS domain containing-hemolysin-like protein